MRPSAPGKRETPSRSIDFHTSRRTLSLEGVCAGTSPKHIDASRPTHTPLHRAGRMRPMAPERTSLAGLPPSAEPKSPGELPAGRDRELLPAIEPERRVTDWGRSERVEGFMDQTLIEFFY